MEAIVLLVEKSCHAFYVVSAARGPNKGTYKDSLYENDNQNDNSESEIRDLRSRLAERFPAIRACHGQVDSPSDKAQDRSDKENCTETSEHVGDPPEKISDLITVIPMRMSCLLEKHVWSMRGDLIWTVLFESPLGNFEIETDLLTDVESLKSFIACQEMPFELGDISDVIPLDRWLVRALLRFRHVDG